MISIGSRRPRAGPLEAAATVEKEGASGVSEVPEAVEEEKEAGEKEEEEEEETLDGEEEEDIRL